MWEAVRTTIEPGLIYSIGAIGLALSYRYLRFPDFTVIGSIMLGGVATVFFMNSVSSLAAVGLGTAVGGIAGLATGIVYSQLRIRPVLAGIITYTASFTFGFLFCGGSSEISMSPGAATPLIAIYSLEDVFKILSVLTVLVIALSLFMITKWGGLVLAMTATPQFIDFRHRHKEAVIVFVLFISNALVGLAGGLYALNDRGASVYSHQDFLPLALASVFAADALIKWAAGVTNRYRSRPPELRKVGSRASKFFASLFFIEKENSPRIWLLLTGYALSCVMFTLISRSIYVGVLDEWVVVSQEWQYLVVALLMTGFVWWSSMEDA